MSTSSTKASVERQFSRSAENYRTSSVHATGAEFDLMVRAAQLTGAERVLDAGCGAGHTAVHFAPHVREVVALDLSESMLAQVTQLAHERGLDNIRTESGDVEQLPFADGSFDLVVSRYSAHHWPAPEEALAEFRRILAPAPKTQLLIADVISTDNHVVDTFIQAMELLRDPSHVRDHSLRQWMHMFEEAGFGAAPLLHWDLRLEFHSWVERIGTPALYVTALEQLLDEASQEVRSFLSVEADRTFTFRSAVISGCLR